VSEVKITHVDLPIGYNTIEVFNPTEETKLSCTCSDSASKMTGFNQTNVKVCRGSVLTKHPMTMDISVTNLDKSVVEYLIVRTTL
jgi:hypothetical protein